MDLTLLSLSFQVFDSISLSLSGFRVPASTHLFVDRKLLNKSNRRWMRMQAVSPGSHISPIGHIDQAGITGAPPACRWTGCLYRWTKSSQVADSDPVRCGGTRYSDARVVLVGPALSAVWDIIVYLQVGLPASCEQNRPWSLEKQDYPVLVTQLVILDNSLQWTMDRHLD